MPVIPKIWPTSHLKARKIFPNQTSLYKKYAQKSTCPL